MQGSRFAGPSQGRCYRRYRMLVNIQGTDNIHDRYLRVTNRDWRAEHLNGRVPESVMNVRVAAQHQGLQKHTAVERDVVQVNLAIDSLEVDAWYDRGMACGLRDVEEGCVFGQRHDWKWEKADSNTTSLHLWAKCGFYRREPLGFGFHGYPRLSPMVRGLRVPHFQRTATRELSRSFETGCGEHPARQTSQRMP